MMKKIFSAIILSALFSFSSQAKTYVLVHGAMTDGTVWFKIKPLLEAKGNKVVVVNLPGHGKDNTPVDNINYNLYASVIADSINAQSSKVILVGHSMAGLLIASVAEKIPSKIEALVFLAAFMPQNGHSVFQLNGSDKQSQFGPNLLIDSAKTSATMKLNMIEKVFCADCSNSDKALLILSHKAEPLAPLAEKVILNESIYDNIPKYSIQTLYDNAVGYNIQKELSLNSKNVRKVFIIKSGHLPFLSKPAQLAAILQSIR